MDGFRGFGSRTGRHTFHINRRPGWGWGIKFFALSSGQFRFLSEIFESNENRIGLGNLVTFVNSTVS